MRPVVLRAGVTHLFQPLTLRGTTFPNRAWVAPMCQYSAVDGVPGDWHLVHLGGLAKGGFGLVLAEATAVVPEGRISPQDTGIWNDDQQHAWARIVDFAHAQGTLIGVQLAHAGRKGSTYRPWAGSRGTVPADEGGWSAQAPSAVAYPGYDEPEALDAGGLARVVAGFASAAARARDAGFDVVEVHAAHGYLLHEFLSPLSNRRTDGYGGDLDGRLRLLLEVVAAVRAEWPGDRPLFVRFSASDWAEGGWTVEDTAEATRRVAALGADLVDVSSGGLVNVPVPVGPGYQVPMAREVRLQTGLPVAAVGLITEPDQAEQVLTDGSADVVLLARAALRDPMWARRAAHELGVPVADLPWPDQYSRGGWPEPAAARP